MARIAIFIDHDITIRHFISNGLLQTLDDKNQLFFVFPQNHRRVKTDLPTLGLSDYRTIQIDNDRNYRWRRLYQHMAIRRIRRGRNDRKKGMYAVWLEVLGKRTYWKTWLYSLPGFYFFYERSARRHIGENKQLNSLMKEIVPDVIIHPTVLEGLFVSDLIVWGKKHKVPTIYLMNSWDNPSTKAMTVGNPDWLVVWGEQTRRDAVQDMGMDPARVLPFGAAQFQVYRDPCIFSPQEFRDKLSLAHDTKILLYAGSSKGLNEVEHLRQLDLAIESGRLPPVHIVFRPHPWRGPVRGEVDFESVKFKNVSMDPGMVEFYHLWKNEPLAIYKADIRMTHALLNAVDLVVSPLSTILLEAGMHDKPVLAYLPSDEVSLNDHARTTMFLHYFKEFYENLNCGPVSNLDELIKRVSEIITASDRRPNGEIRKLTDFFVLNIKESYIDLLRAHIDRICAKNNLSTL